MPSLMPLPFARRGVKRQSLLSAMHIRLVWCFLCVLSSFSITIGFSYSTRLLKALTGICRRNEKDGGFVLFYSLCVRILWVWVCVYLSDMTFLFDWAQNKIQYLYISDMIFVIEWALKKSSNSYLSDTTNKKK